LYFTDGSEYDKFRRYFSEKYSRFNPNVSRQLSLVFGNFSINPGNSYWIAAYGGLPGHIEVAAQ
jgi:hypothetical protein